MLIPRPLEAATKLLRHHSTYILRLMLMVMGMVIAMERWRVIMMGLWRNQAEEEHLNASQPDKTHTSQTRAGSLATP